MPAYDEQEYTKSFDIKIWKRLGPYLRPRRRAFALLIAMNLPSLLKFEPSVVPNGTVFVNSSIIQEKVQRPDVRAVYVPCLEIAQDLGNLKVANMVMLGAYIEAMKNLGTETIKEMLVHMFTGPKAKLVDLNIEALRRGAACVR